MMQTDARSLCALYANRILRKATAKVGRIDFNAICSISDTHTQTHNTQFQFDALYIIGFLKKEQ